MSDNQIPPSKAFPYDEIVIRGVYDIGDGHQVVIYAGANTAEIIWPDGEGIYRDSPAGTKKNFDEAYNRMISRFPNATKINSLCLGFKSLESLI